MLIQFGYLVIVPGIDFKPLPLFNSGIDSREVSFPLQTALEI